MKNPKILCVCLGNSDRSPFMAALLERMIRQQGSFAYVHSAGTSPGAAKGGAAPALSVSVAKTYGIDLSGHRKRHVDNLTNPRLEAYDLIIAADKEVLGYLANRVSTEVEIICLDLDGRANAWKTQDPNKVHDMVESITVALMRDVIRHRFRIEA